ncbi:MAG: ATP-grasp domain-containing protein [Gemmatimonadota bacterium]|nr:ATP-grasp domain-containing protein [Gemmatimonadota bacterium]
MNYKISDPLRDPELFLSDLERLVASTQADVLLPISEAALLLVLPNRNRFPCIIPFATASAFDQVCDKRKVLETAGIHGIAVPNQTEIDKPTDISRFSDDLQFPLVLKPSRSIAGKEGKRIRAGVAYATNAQNLRDELKRIPSEAYPILLQQRIDGPGFGVSVLLWDGKLLAAFAHRRIREKPPSGGVSVLRESIPLDQKLLSQSLALLRDFKWQGVAMVEYKLDADNGLPYLMEINGRFWGSLQLAIDAGVDFPNLLVELALGGNPAPVTTYNAGVRSRWEWGDMDHLLAAMLHASASDIIPGATLKQQRLAAIAEFVRGFNRENRAEVFRRDDPRPFLRETVDWFLRR